MEHPVRKILTALLSTGACLGGAEYLLWRVADSQYQEALTRFKHPLYELAPAPLYYLPREVIDRRQVVAKPGLPETRWRFSIHAGGLRGERTDLSKLPPTTRRVLFLGDSYTFGECVDWQDTFVQQIEGLFEAQGVAVKCINAGVMGYNSEQEYGMLLRVFERYQPHAVVLGYVANDAQAINFVPRSPDYTYRYASSMLFERCKPLLNSIGAALIRAEPLFTPRILDGTNDYALSFSPGHAGQQESRQYLVAMHEYCEARGVPFLVFVLPGFIWKFDARYGFFQIPDAVQGWGRDAGFPVYALLPQFLGMDSASLSVPGDGHPNPRAHRLMAEMMHQQLARLFQ